MKTIYIHIGMPKTGTTAIQAFFSANRDAVKKMGVLYPSNCSSGGAHFDISSYFSFALGKKQIINENCSIEALEKEIEDCDCESVVISSENFILNGNYTKLKEFFNNYNVKIIVYLRRHDKWWPSAYQQSIKQVSNPKWGSTFQSFLNYQQKYGQKYWHYADLLDKWANVFGVENILVRVFEKQQMGLDVVEDFIKLVGLEDIIPKIGKEFSKAGFVNDSVNALSLQLIDVYQRLDAQTSTKNTLIKHAYTVESPYPAKLLCPQHILNSLVEESKADYEYIARRYLGRSDGKLFLEPLDEAEQDVAVPELSMIKVVEETVSALNLN